MSDAGPDIAPELFERAKAGDKRAVDVVLAALRPAMVARATAHLRRYPDDADADAEDVAQTALLWVWQNIAKAESPAKLVALALKATLNDSRDMRRSNHRRRQRVVVSSDIVDFTTEEGRPLSNYGTPLGNGGYRTPPAHIDYEGDESYE